MSKTKPTNGWVSVERDGKTMALVQQPISHLLVAKLSSSGWKRAIELGIERGPGGRCVIPPILVQSFFDGCSASAPGVLNSQASNADRLKRMSLTRSDGDGFLSQRSGESLPLPTGAGEWSWRHGEIYGIGKTPLDGDFDHVNLLGEPETRSLYPYQIAGVQWLEAAKGRGILGDEMGLGKTPQALVYLSRSDASRALIVAPRSVLWNWKREAETWAPEWEFAVADSSAKVRRAINSFPARRSSAPQALVVTWGLLHRSLEDLIGAGFDTVVADEAHMAKNPSAKRTIALMDLAFSSKRLLLLTGTPVRNRPRELWPLLHMVDPCKWPAFIPYGETYCGARNLRVRNRIVRTYDGATKRKMEELNALTRPFMLRREKDDVLTQLPPKRTERISLPTPRPLLKSYKDAVEQLRLEIVHGMTPMALGLLASLRSECGLAKVDAAVEWLLNLHQSGEPCVVFIFHKAVRQAVEEALTKAGISHASIVGDTPSLQRQSITESFQRGELDVVIGSEACKEGITLTRASHVLFVEYWWTPGDLAQAEARVHRISQERPVLISYLHLEGTDAERSLDDHVFRLLECKEEVISKINDRGFNSVLLDSLSGGSR